MADFKKMLENLKMSDLRIAKLTEEVKEMDAEAKKKETEIASSTLAKKQAEKDLKFKEKVLCEREFELNLSRKKFDVWTKFLEEKRDSKIKEEEELDSIIKSIWDVRIKFSNDVNKFLESNDFLIHGAEKMQSALKERKDEEMLDKEIEDLEKDVKELEKELHDWRQKEKLVGQMERVKEELSKEPETSNKFLRIKALMQKHTIEAGELEQEIARLECSDPPKTPSHGVPFRPPFSGENSRRDNIQTDSIKKVKKFIPKAPSAMIKTTTLQEDVNSIYYPE